MTCTESSCWTSWILVAALPWLVRGNSRHLRHHAIYVAMMLVLIVASALAVPLYHRWYNHMRRPGSDERALDRGPR